MRTESCCTSSASMGKIFGKIYFDPSHPASFKGPNKLYQVVVKEGTHKISPGQIRKWLQDQESYSLKRPVRKIKRMRVIVTGLHDQYDADLADFIGYYNANDGIRYLLVVIDVFSHYLWVEPVQNKSDRAVVEAFLHKVLSLDSCEWTKVKNLQVTFLKIISNPSMWNTLYPTIRKSKPIMWRES